MLSYKTPGVYIEELPANGPIEGVGTSTVAFIGPAMQGPNIVPTKITNWTQFTQIFGGYITSPRRYLAYGVRGFFDNGGTVAYIVRIGNAVRAWLDLEDSETTPALALRATALVEGPSGNNVTVQVQNAQIVTNAKVRRAQAPITAGAKNVITLQLLADAQLFKPGDWLTITGSTERVQIDRIRGNQLFLTSNLTTSYAVGPSVRIADLLVGQKTFRVQNVAGLEPGSAIHLEQTVGAGTTKEDISVDGVVGEFVTVSGAGLANTYLLTSTSNDAAISSYEFNLIFSSGATVETFAKLAMDSRHSKYYLRQVVSTLVELTPADPPSPAVVPLNRPAVLSATSLTNGVADTLGTIGLAQFQTGLDALLKLDDVNIVCAPDADQNVQAAMVAHCEQVADRFAILDPTQGQMAPFGTGSIESQRSAVESARGYAALYYPWIIINDPNSATGEDTLSIPPSGHMAGIYSRSDAQRGVHKAPANELIVGAVGLTRSVDASEQGELNIEGINVLRIFAGKVLPVVWGARTTAPKDETAWRYVNVRRLFLFVEQSIQQGIAWAIFEPNDVVLWQKLHRTLDEFLTRVWRSGALFGATAAQAFYIKIDEELNPASVRALGQVIIEVGIAPVRPAEFVVVRIGMWDGGSTTQEG